MVLILYPNPNQLHVHYTGLIILVYISILNPVKSLHFTDTSWWITCIHLPKSYNTQYSRSSFSRSHNNGPARPPIDDGFDQYKLCRGGKLWFARRTKVATIVQF